LFSLSVSACAITLSVDQENKDQIIKESFVEPCYLQNISYESDVYLQESEFFYLTDLRSGLFVSAHEIARAVSYLFKKNKFQTIELTSMDVDAGIDLHIKLTSFWTFSKLKLHGIMLGKDLYRQYYLLEPGERFDQEKHDLSLEKIKEAFKAQGYFNGSIESRLERDEATKSITAHLSLYKHERFSIGSTSIEIDPGACAEQSECNVFRAKLYRSFLKKMVGAHYNKQFITSQIRVLQKYLFKKGFVHVLINLREQIDYSKKKVNLFFTIQLHRKKEFIFLGNHHLSVDQLFNYIALFGRSAWILPTAMLQQDITELYHKKGFWDVEITSREEQDRCFFIIKEGKRAVIKKVILAGINTFDLDMLVKKFFSSLIKKKQYDAQALDVCIASFINFYKQEGFLDCKIVGRDFERIGVTNGYELRLTVDTGEHMTLRQAQGARMMVSDVHDKTEQDAFDKLSTSLTVHPELVEGRWACETKSNDQPEQVTFGKTIVMGSNTFPFDYIMRELSYGQGQVWDKTLLKSSLLNLRKLELFDSIYLYPERRVNQELENSILLKIQKDDPFELRVRLGFAAQQVSKSIRTAGLTYRAGGSFLIKNPFNYADRLLFEADVTRSSRTTLLQYRLPWIFNAPIATIFQLYSNRYEQPGLIGSVKNLYDVKQQGFLVGFSGVHSTIEASMNVGIEWIETNVCDDTLCTERVIDNLVHAINFTPCLLDRNIPYIILQPTLLLDYVDNRLDPTRGCFTLFSCKGMVPLDRLHVHAYFVRASIEQSFFLPFYSAVFALRVRFGHIFNHSLTNIAPTERFYLGGANSVRSYETDRCPPLGIFVNDKGCVQWVPRGGKTLGNMNLEVRFPIYKHIKGVVFQDLGLLTTNFTKQNLFNSVEQIFSAGTGFGVRYGTPIGPIRMDIAWKWRRSHPKELPYAWFMTFGHAF